MPTLSMSALKRVKRTYLILAVMSANDPKRTSATSQYALGADPTRALYFQGCTAD